METNSCICERGVFCVRACEACSIESCVPESLRRYALDKDIRRKKFEQRYKHGGHDRA